MTARGILLGAVLLALAGSAYAQDTSRDPGQAEVLFQSGVALLKKDDWASACPKFEESMRLEPSVGAQINISRCREHEGKLARAWTEFDKARSLNRDTPAGPRQQETDAYLRDELARLEPRLPRLVVRVANAPQGLQIELDGRAISTAALGEALPIDPGRHLLVASAPGHAPLRREFDAPEGARVEQSLALELAAAGPTDQTSSRRVPTTSRADSRPIHGRVVAGVVLVGAGIVSLGASVVTGALALARRNELDDLVADHRCTSIGTKLACPSSDDESRARDTSRQGESLAFVSTMTLAIGIAAAAGGLTLVLTAPSKNSGRTVTLAPSVGGVQLGGAF